MPSPFPGMDPYLEDPALWPGVHQSLITYIRDDLQPDLRPAYGARIGERLYVVERVRDIYPDVFITEQADRPRGGVAVAEIATDAPTIVRVEMVEFREPYIEIFHTGSSEVVTVIEIPSPANKTPGKGRELYRQKQTEVLDSQTHLVEIDLLHEGQHTVAVPQGATAPVQPYRYLLCVNRATDRAGFELYPFQLMDRLPRPRIPLRAPDPDVGLDLPAIFNRCYDNGGYPDFVNYAAPPPGQLSEPEGESLKKLLRL